MAIRIDLLPGYVGLRRWFKRILVACVALVGLFAVVLSLLYYRDQLVLQTLKTNRQNIETFAKQTEAADEARDKAVAEAKPMQDAVNFFVDAGRTGSERAALLDLIHRYIYADAELRVLDLSDGQNVVMEAKVASPDKYANFLMRLRNGTVPTGVLFKDLPSGAGIKGYPAKPDGNAQQAGAPDMVPTAAGAPGAVAQDNAVGVIRYRNLPNSISIKAALNEPVVIPAPPGGAATQAAGAAVDPAMAGDPAAPPPAP